MARYTASRFVAGSPDALVIGQTMMAFIENVDANLIAPIMARHNLSEMKPDQWYSHQTWMDILRELSDSLGGQASSVFVAIGRDVVHKAVMPPEMNSIPVVLNALHAIHHLNLRNIPEDEGYVVKQLDAKHYQVYANTPNPDHAIYGFIWGLCARFKQPNESFTVRIMTNPHPEDIPGTLFDVVWG